MAAPSPVAVLERADRARLLPRLGGMARPNGVVIASERFWAFATTDGRLLEGRTPPRPHALGRVPLLRGLVRLGAALAPLFRGRGVARRPERAFLALALLAPFAFVVLPERVEALAGAAVTALLFRWATRGRTLHLHGAEHRAIAAAQERRLLATWRGEARPARFAARCGTNFAVLVLPVAALAERLWPLPATFYTPLVVALLSLALTMELWLAIEGSARRAARLFLLPGIGLQRLTTREPSLAETRLALAATASVLRRELDQ